MNKIKNFLSVLFCLAIFANAQGRSKDSVIIIRFTDSTKIRKQNESVFASSTPGYDSSRFIKRKKVAKDIPLTHFKVNKTVFGPLADFIVDYVKNYHFNHGDRIDRISSRSKGQFKLIENIMKRYNLPREMKSLAIIESALNCNAVSPVGAVGPWQFMAPTAKMLGLRVDAGVDERVDFYKSTQAAAKYLKQLYGIFGDWLLVIASYNCGPAPVLRAINSGMGNSFWDIKAKLPRETQNHVMAFIATSVFLDKYSNVLAMGNIPKGAKAPKPDFSNLNQGYAEAGGSEEKDGKKPKFSQDELDNMAVLKVKGNYKLNSISIILDEDLVRLKRWNPDFDETIANSSTPVHLRIPINKLEKFIISKEEILSHSLKGRS